MRGLFSLITKQHAYHARHDGRNHVYDENARVPRAAYQHDGCDEPKQDDGADDELQGFH